MTQETHFDQLLAILVQNKVSFVLIGGLAGIAHGSGRATVDVDVVYQRTPENILRLVTALESIDPYPRGIPSGLPFFWDQRTIEDGLNFTLTTRAGDIDLLGETPGDGTYESILADSVKITVFELECDCVSLPRLIQLKKAAGRPKDFEAIAELEYLLEMQRDSDNQA